MRSAKMLEAKGFPKAQSYPEGIPSILENLWTQQVARDRRENRSAQAPGSVTS